MPLQTQIVDVPFAGVDQKTAVELVPPGKFITVDNGIFVKRGEVRKRYGFVNLPDVLTPGTLGGVFPFPADGSYITSEALLTRGSELLLIGESTTYPSRRTMGSFSQVTNKWNSVDFPTNVRSTQVYSSNIGAVNVTQPCVAAANNVGLFVSINGGRLFAKLVDLSTNSDIPSLLTVVNVSAASVNSCVVGDWLFATYALPAGDLAVWAYNTITGEETARQIAGFFVTDPYYDIAPYADNGSTSAAIIVCYLAAGNVIRATVISSDTTAAPLGLGNVLTAGSPITNISICYSKDTNPPANPTLWTTWTDGSASHVNASTYSFFTGWTSLGTTVVQSSSQKVRCCLVTDDKAFVVANNSSGFVEWALYNSSAAAVKVGQSLQGMFVCSQPFIDSGIYTAGYAYAVMLYWDATEFQNTTYLVRFDISSGISDYPVPVAKLGSSTGPSVPNASHHWKVSASGNDAYVAVPEKERIVQTVGSSIQSTWGYQAYGLTLNGTRGYLFAESQNCTHIASGALLSYDGNMLSEIGFSNYPVIAAPTVNAGPGGGLSAGSYAYSVVYSWQDDQGRIHRSAPSAPQVVTAAAGDDVDVVVETPATSWRWRVPFNRPVVAELYRTLVDGSVTSSLDGFYFVSRTALPAYGSVTINDSATDDSIADNPQIYTAGGVLECVMPPSCSVVALHKNRLWVNSAEDNDVIWFSRELYAGEAPAFNEILTVAVPGGGRVTGISPMDTRLIVFKEDRVFVVYGDGPNDQGAGGQFTAEQLQPIQLGCIDERSVQRTSFGTFFYSSQGLFVMTRSLDAQQVGARVEDSLNQYRYFAGVVSMPTNQEIRLVVRETEGSSEGKVVVYNTFFDEWSTWTIKNFNAEVLNPAATVICNNRHYVADAYGIVWVEDKTCWYDACGAPNEQWVTLTLTSPWIRMGAVEGFQRVRRIGLRSRSTDAYSLSVQVETDYGNESNSKYPWQTSTFEWAGTDQESRFAQVHVAQQISPAIRVTLTDAPPTSGTSTGQGPALVGLSLELGLKSGENKLPAVWRK
jgi:hypothetical protein